MIHWSKQEMDSLNTMHNQDILDVTNPFKRGEIVKCIIDGKELYGVVDTSQKEWNQMYQSIQQNRISKNVHYLYVSVSCLDDNNHFFNIECLPSDIEKASRQSLGDNYCILTNAENLLKYETSLAKFIEMYEKYKK